ncbi:MAG: HlyD family efflux transporter periplasmic adaptor subunit [Acidobacteriia bacterium]|nr:HlyD family efflux transporter periplasmic adaptor subunit [Terriglobia bacterium]
MRFGPTSLRLSGVHAKGLRRPQFRADLKVSKQNFGGEVSYVFKIPETDSFNRLGEFDWEVLALCDGTRTPGEIAQALCERYPDQSFSEAEILEFLESIDPNAWERTSAEKNLCILGKIRDERRQRVNRASLLYIYFSAFDPDRALTWLNRRTGWLFTKPFVILSLVVFALAFIIVGRDFGRFWAETSALYSFSNKTFADIALMWVMLFIVVGPHEFAHGLACKHYGGEVHHMGFMLLYFSPSFYTDCTEMALFDATRKRIWTILAGIWITLWQCCLAIFIWALSPPGSLTGNLAYEFALMSGIPAFMQLNPLMKIDGYYTLMQILQIDNLREQSFAYLNAWLKRTFLRQDVELPAASRRERRIYLVYASLAAVYGVLVLVLLLGFVNNIFVKHLGNWGYLATAGVLYLMLRAKIRKASALVRASLRGLKEKFMAWRMTRWQQVAGAAALLVLVVPPTAVKVTSNFLLEPARRVEVRAPVAGFIQQVDVQEGESVPAGKTLAVLHNADIETRVAVADSQLQMGEDSLRVAQASVDFATIAKYSQETRRLEAEKADANRKRDGLTLRAPFDGVVATPRVEQRVGEYLAEGAPLATLVDRHAMRAHILVRDWELEDVRPGARVALKLESYPFQTFPGVVRQIMPAASSRRPVSEPQKIERHGQELTNFFEVEMEFPNPQGQLREGMTGAARIYGKRYPLAWRALRAGYRWIHSQIW